MNVPEVTISELLENESTAYKNKGRQ